MILFLQLYLVIGILFGLSYVTRGYFIVAPAAKGSPVRFRLLILPASIALWPYLLKRWLKAEKKK